MAYTTVEDVRDLASRTVEQERPDVLLGDEQYEGFIQLAAGVLDRAIGKNYVLPISQTASTISWNVLKAANEVGALYYAYSLLLDRSGSASGDSSNPWSAQWDELLEMLDDDRSLPDALLILDVDTNPQSTMGQLLRGIANEYLASHHITLQQLLPTGVVARVGDILVVGANKNIGLETDAQVAGSGLTQTQIRALFPQEVKGYALRINADERVPYDELPTDIARSGDILSETSVRNLIALALGIRADAEFGAAILPPRKVGEGSPANLWGAYYDNGVLRYMAPQDWWDAANITVAGAGGGQTEAQVNSLIDQRVILGVLRAEEGHQIDLGRILPVAQITGRGGQVVALNDLETGLVTQPYYSESDIKGWVRGFSLTDGPKVKPSDLLASPTTGKLLKIVSADSWAEIDEPTGGGSSGMIEYSSGSFTWSNPRRTFKAPVAAIALPDLQPGEWIVVRWRDTQGNHQAHLIFGAELLGLTAVSAGDAVTTANSIIISDSASTGAVDVWIGHDSNNNILAASSASMGDFVLKVTHVTSLRAGSGGRTQAEINAALFDADRPDVSDTQYDFAAQDKSDSSLVSFTEGDLRDMLLKDPGPFVNVLKKRILSGAVSIEHRRTLPDPVETLAQYTEGAIVVVQPNDLAPVRVYVLGADKDETVTVRSQVRVLGDGDEFKLGSKGSAQNNEGINGNPIILQTINEDLPVPGNNNEFSAVINPVAAGFAAAPADLFVKVDGSNMQTLVKGPEQTIAGQMGFRYSTSTFPSTKADQIADDWAANRVVRIDFFTDASGHQAQNVRPATETIPGQWVEVPTQDALDAAPEADAALHQIAVFVEQSTKATLSVEMVVNAGQLVYRQGINNVTEQGSVHPAAPKLLEVEAFPNDYTQVGDRKKWRISVPAGFGPAPVSLALDGTTYALTKVSSDQTFANNLDADVYATAPVADEDAPDTSGPHTQSMAIRLADDSYLGSSRHLAKLTALALVNMLLNDGGHILVNYLNTLPAGSRLDRSKMDGPVIEEIVTSDEAVRSTDRPGQKRIKHIPGERPVEQFLERGNPVAEANRQRASFYLSRDGHPGGEYDWGANVGTALDNTAIDGGPFVGYIEVNALPNNQWAWEIAARFDWLSQYAVGVGPSEFYIALGTETVRLSDADPIAIHAPTRTQSGRTFKRYTGALTTAQANYTRQATPQPYDFYTDSGKANKIEFRPAQIIPPLRWNDSVAPLIPPQVIPHSAPATDTQRPNTAGNTISQLTFTVAVGDKVNVDAAAFIELIPGANLDLKLTYQQQGDTSETDLIAAQTLSVIGAAASEQMYVPLFAELRVTVAGTLVIKLIATSNSNTNGHQVRQRNLRATQFGVPRYAS